MKVADVLRAGATAAYSNGICRARSAAQAKAPSTREEPRIVALDGLRGLMTIMVVVSHFFAEVPNGWHALAFGWIAVTMFFVLSGYLVGRLILEKQDRANFFKVFYVRRVCRTLPVYIFCVTLVFLILQAVPSARWADADVMFPLWSYLTFTQNFFMVATDSIGAHWLAPTWTLTVEEHFYLIAPALFFLVPRRHLLTVFAVTALLTTVYRFAAFEFGLVSKMTCLILLPGVASGLLFGLMAAVLMKTDGIDWQRHDFTLRIGPLVLLLATGALKLIDGETGQSFNVLSDATVSAALRALYPCSRARGTGRQAAREQGALLLRQYVLQHLSHAPCRARPHARASARLAAGRRHRGSDCGHGRGAAAGGTRRLGVHAPRRGADHALWPKLQVERGAPRAGGRSST